MKATFEPSKNAPQADLRMPISLRLELCEAALARTDSERASSTVRTDRTVKPFWPNWQEALRGQLGTSGVIFRNLAASLEEVLDGIRPGVPIVTWTPQTGWTALLESDRGRVRVASAQTSARWIPAGELRSSVDSSLVEGTHSWVALEAALLSGTPSVDDRGRPTPLGRLLAIVRPERSDLVAIILYSAFTGLMSLAIPVAVQQLVNTVAYGGLVQPVVVLAFLLFIGLAIAACLSSAQAFLAELLQQRIFVRACLDLAQRLPRLREEAFESRPMVAYVNRFFDLVTLQKSGARLLLEGSGVVLQAMAGLFVLSLYHPLMLALSIFLFGAMGIVTVSFGCGAPTSAIHESSVKHEIGAL